MTIHNKDLTDMSITIADLEQRATSIKFEIACGERKVREARLKVKRWENTRENLQRKLGETNGEISMRNLEGWLAL